MPALGRDQSRLLVLNRQSNRLEHRGFRDLLQYLSRDDVLVLNNSRVIPARLRGANARTGGQFEVLLLEENAANDWWVMLRPGKRARIGTEILFRDLQGKPSSLSATVAETNAEGHRRLRFLGDSNVLDLLDSIGETPLPPYIQRRDTSETAQDRDRYQTVFAEPAGSVAAPTAGLHFTNSMLSEIRAKGVHVCFVTLHVGLGTFAPVKAEELAKHTMHEERYRLDQETVERIQIAREKKNRVVAVGTTTLRVLESVAAQHGGKLIPGAGRTRIFIYPPYDFKIVDVLLTNFHLPRSTLLMLASAFAAPGKTRGQEMILEAYAEAIREGYRFFSYGDAMLIV